ncbi:predicted protein [Paecilomyces variotii No. 5]|uniref:Oxidoreductase acuF-like C2H2 type zinc-finger domain-containing protein n=1 Tax=Byssochlamys spectabilis (strain No. 5 / NBRC 109023) TaxID=1356009 RepID=V5I2T1_BYSSN|nr:predicted protein [Paecilomyces variotii No. 5]
MEDPRYPKSIFWPSDVGLRQKKMTIALVLKDCLNKFTALLESGHLVHFQTEVALRRWEDELGRLRVWAANIEAHQTGESSLDYRLRDASHLKNETITLLQRFHDTLNDLNDLDVGGGRVSTDDDNENETIAEFHQHLRESDDYNTTEAQDIYQNMVELVNHLYRISMAIRQPAQHDQLLAARSIDRTDFKHRAQLHVYDKYPRADTYLVDRIGTAMAMKKAILEYRERHGVKLSQEVYGHNDSDSEALSSKLSGTVATEPVVNQDPPGILEHISNTSASRTSSAGAPVETEDPLSVPPPPESSNDRKPFQCPYCLVIITVEDLDDWARHVFNDLMPYVCIFPDCSSPSRLHESRNKWSDHLSWEHSLSSSSNATLTCPLCKCGIQQLRASDHVGHHLRDLALFVLQHDKDMSMEEYIFNDLILPEPLPVAESARTQSLLQKKWEEEAIKEASENQATAAKVLQRRACRMKKKTRSN